MPPLKWRMIVLQSLVFALANRWTSSPHDGEPGRSLGVAGMGRVPAREPLSPLFACQSLPRIGEGGLNTGLSEGSPAGCGKLATFHVVARDEVPGNAPMTSRSEGAPDLRPIPSHGLASPTWLAEIGWRLQLREGGSHPHEPSHLDSCHPKSTVELGCEPLNWGENALRTLQMSALASSKPLGIQGILTTFWTQTEIQPNQARKLFPTVDLGCLKSSSSCSLGAAKQSEGGVIRKCLICKTNPIVRIAMVRQSPIIVQGRSNPVQPNPGWSNHFKKKMYRPTQPKGVKECQNQTNQAVIKPNFYK
jgi:hypothetical protein